MSRTRLIKPGFFLNEELGRLPPLDRILFAGLWTIADREGRLEDRPVRIKAEVLPFDDYDVDAALDRLAAAGFIRRYFLGTLCYACITKFHKHQRPHARELPSEIPEFTEETRHNLGSAQAQPRQCYSLTLNPSPLTLNLSSPPLPSVAAPLTATVADKPPPRTKGSRRVPSNWEPNVGHRDLARVRNVEFDSELAKFRDYEFARGKSDWDATFRNWLRNADERRPQAGFAKRRQTADERKLEAIRRSDELFDRLTRGAHGPERSEADREQPGHALPAGLVGGKAHPFRH
jgi:hypothetical protein